MSTGRAQIAGSYGTPILCGDVWYILIVNRHINWSSGKTHQTPDGAELLLVTVDVDEYSMANV